MKAKSIISLMDSWALPELIDHWDNTGFQIGDEEKDVKKILVSLDVDMEVYIKSLKENIDMIIAHHPLIFKPVNSITKSSYKERLIYDLIKNDIVVYNAHSNLDQAVNGINDELAKVLGLKNTKVLKPSKIDESGGIGYGRIGEIEEVEFDKYIQRIKKALDVESLKVYGYPKDKIKKVAVCGGSGSEFIYDAFKNGACIYITGDIKYHDAQLGNELGIAIIDAGHYDTEKVILPVIKNFLETHSSKNIDVIIYDNPSPICKLY